MGSFSGEKRIKPRRGRTASRAAATKAAARVKGRDGRANAKYRVYLFAESHRNLSIRGLRDFMLAEQAAGSESLRDIPIPPRASLQRLLAAGDAAKKGGTLSVLSFVDDPRPGRPRKLLDPRVASSVHDLILLRPNASLTYFLEDAEEIAEEFGLPKPTLHQIEVLFNSIPVEDKSAARHGSKAARADTMQRATIPTKRPHEVWTLDELLVPVWIKAFHPLELRLVSVKTHAVLIADNHSRVIVGIHVVPPFSDEEAQVGYRGTDVTGAFYGAALKELSHPDTRMFAGHLPGMLRMDNHSTHAALREIASKNGVHIPSLPSLVPYSRGLVERLVGSFKRICEPIRGHEDSWLPADQVGEDPRTTRSVAAAALGRVGRKTIIPVEDLYDVHELREELGKAITRYHHRVHRILRTTPMAVYQERHRPREARKGIDVLTWLEVVRLKVLQGRIEHSHVVFAARAAGRELRHGSQVNCRIEPLNRGLFADFQGATFFLAPWDVVAENTNPGTLAHEQQKAAREASDHAEELHRIRLEAATGPDAPIRAEIEMKASIARAKQGSRERAQDRKTRKEEKQTRARQRRTPAAVDSSSPPVRAPARHPVSTPAPVQVPAPDPDVDEFPLGIRKTFTNGRKAG